MKTLNPVTIVALIMSCILLLFAAYGAYFLIRMKWSRIKANRTIDTYMFCEAVHSIENIMDGDFYHVNQEFVKEKIWKLGLDVRCNSGKQEQVNVLLKKYQTKYFKK